jgi:hypothetical protein
MIMSREVMTGTPGAEARRRIARASLALSALLCLLGAAPPAGSLVVAGWRGYQQVTGSSFEQLRLAQYGDCGGHGYGYVTRVLDGFPAPDAMPRVRYPDFDHYVRFLLPQFRTRLDDRVLIGIGVADQLLHDERIAAARRVESELPSAGRWLFITQWDYDLLTGATVELAKPLARSVRFDLVLRHSTMEPTVLAHWNVEVPANAGPVLSLRLDQPVENFSVARGGLDFVLDVAISDPGAASIIGVSAVGVRVDGRGYSVVRRDGGCFLALHTGLLNEIRETPDHPWRPWLERVQGGR